MRFLKSLFSAGLNRHSTFSMTCDSADNGSDDGFDDVPAWAASNPAAATVFSPTSAAATGSVEPVFRGP